MRIACAQLTQQTRCFTVPPREHSRKNGEEQIWKSMCLIYDSHNNKEKQNSASQSKTEPSIQPSLSKKA
jgi:hypothetical protein